MGKQGKERKRRKFAPMVADNSEISPQDLNTTIKTLTALTNDPNLLKGPNFKLLRTVLYKLNEAKEKSGVMNGILNLYRNNTFW